MQLIIPVPASIDEQDTNPVLLFNNIEPNVAILPPVYENVPLISRSPTVIPPVVIIPLKLANNVPAAATCVDASPKFICDPNVVVPPIERFCPTVRFLPADCTTLPVIVVSCNTQLAVVVAERIPVAMISPAVTSVILTAPPNVPPTDKLPATNKSPPNVPAPEKSAAPITPMPFPIAEDVAPTPKKLPTLTSPPNVDTPVFLMNILLIPKESILSASISGCPAIAYATDAFNAVVAVPLNVVAVIIPPGPILIPPAALKDVALNVPLAESNCRLVPAFTSLLPATICPLKTPASTNRGNNRVSVDSSVTYTLLAVEAVPAIVDKPIKFPSNLSITAVSVAVMVENVPTSPFTLP